MGKKSSHGLEYEKDWGDCHKCGCRRPMNQLTTRAVKQKDGTLKEVGEPFCKTKAWCNAERKRQREAKDEVAKDEAQLAALDE